MLIDLLITSSLGSGSRKWVTGGTRSGRLGAPFDARRAQQPVAVGHRCGHGVVGERTAPDRAADTIVKMLGGLRPPVALFTIGTVLWRAGEHVHARTPVALTCRWR